jgi:hypothetical protein
VTMNESGSRSNGRRMAATVSPPSLPGLTPQVGFTRLAARSNAELGQARVPVQSIFSSKGGQFDSANEHEECGLIPHDGDVSLAR